jgi:cold-inducible RNA-binding protein
LRRRTASGDASKAEGDVLICTPFSFRSLCQTCSDEFRTIRKREGATRAAAFASGQRRVAAGPPAGGIRMKLYVGNLSYSTTEDDLRQLFGAHGTPDSVSVISDRGTGRSKGFGFVEFSKDEEAKAAMAALNGKEIDGRALTVSEARPRTEPSGNRGGGGGRGGRY